MSFKLIASGVDGRTSEEERPCDEKAPSSSYVNKVMSKSKLDDEYVALLAKFYNVTPEELEISSDKEKKDTVDVDIVDYCDSSNKTVFSECVTVKNNPNVVLEGESKSCALENIEENLLDSQKIDVIMSENHEKGDAVIEVFCVPVEVHQEEGDNDIPVVLDEDSVNSEVIVSEAEAETDDNLPDIEAKSQTAPFSLRHVNSVSLNPKPLIVFNTLIEKVVVETMLDSGASVSLIRRSVAEKLSVVIDETDQSPVYGYGFSPITPLGSIAVPICLHGYVSLPLKLRVVDDESIDFDAYVGKEFLRENAITVNPHRRKLRHVDKETGAQWDYYIRKPGDESMHLVYSHIPCLATVDVVVDHNVPVEVPVTWNLPGFDDSYSCNSCLLNPPNWYYDGEVVSKNLINDVQGHPGILNGDSRHASILISRISPGVKKIKKGDIVGKLYTLVEITPKEQPQVNLATTASKNEEVTGFNIQDIELGLHLSEDEKAAVYEMLKEVQGVFSKSDDDIGTATIGEHHIKLYDYTPIYQRPRRFPEPVSNEIEKQCHELNAMDIIEPSTSPWSSPVVPVRKPDNSLRLCVDYRKLNKVTIQDRFPMPNLADAVYSLHGVQYFTSLDLVKGYYQLKMAPEDKEYTAFSTAQGHWQFKRLPFGLCNAPASFQRQMLEILKDFPRHQVIVYIDDILILGRDLKQHLLLVRKVLKTLEAHGIKIKLTKCSWFQQKVKFLGHIVSQTGLSKLPSYMKKVEEYPKPETVRQLREFLGLINFQRKFAPHCGEIGKPLYCKTGGNGKRKLIWSEEMDQAFQSLKDLLRQDVELAFPDYSEGVPPLELYVDASGEGAGAYLCQEQKGEMRVIAFNSTSFNEAQRKYNTTEKELVAIRWGVKSFKAFLYGQHFILHTDHQPLAYLHNMQLVDSRLARTLEDLSGFNYDIVYTPGKKNEAADALSRLNPQKLEPQELNGELPEGLKVIDLVPGGGDSLFHSLFIAYGYLLDFEPDDLSVLLPDNVFALRTQLVNYLSNHIEKFGLRKSRDLNKHLKLMKLAGQLPMQEILLVFAELYQVDVYVYYGSDNPVIYKSNSNLKNVKVYLQCLAGIHYNPIRKMKLYRENLVNCCIVERVQESYDFPVLDENICELDEAPIKVLENENNVPRHIICDHACEDSTVRHIRIGNNVYCALLDCGAEINLVSQSVIEENPWIEFEFENQEKFKGLGSCDNSVMGIANIQICLDERVGLQNYPFAVVPEDMMYHCFLIGMNCLDEFDEEIGISEFPYCKDSVHKTGMCEDQDVSCLYNVFYITVQTDFIPVETLLLDQKNDVEISQLIACLRRGLKKRELPRELYRFKRSWDTLKFKDGYLIKVYEGVGVPVISFNYLVNLVLNAHVDMAHIGIFKLYEVLVKNLWHPMLRKVVKDVCGSCSVCQKNKPTAQIVIPPTLKIVTQAPFELMAIDLVSLPTVFQGFVGILVLVDHFSKWLAVAPIRNKQSKTIVNLLEYQIFPSLLKLPFRMLSDNGPEFNSIEFTDLMERLSIHHIKTTAYKPSSNGAVERVNRTVIGFLRDLSSRPTDWNTYLPQAIQVYNNTVHRETGLSPASFLLTKEHSVNDKPILSRESREIWLEGHPQYVSFQVGQPVLKKIPLTGRLNVHKFGPKYDGPYEVVHVNANDVTYELRNLHTNDIVRAHHIQLKPWREPPKYVVDHLQRFPLSLKDVENEFPETQLVENVRPLGSCMYTRKPCVNNKTNEDTEFDVIESDCSDNVSIVSFGGNEEIGGVCIEHSNVNDLLSTPLPSAGLANPLNPEKLNLSVNDLLCLPLPSAGLVTPLKPKISNLYVDYLLCNSLPDTGLATPLEPEKLNLSVDDLLCISPQSAGLEAPLDPEILNISVDYLLCTPHPSTGLETPLDPVKSKLSDIAIPNEELDSVEGNLLDSSNQSLGGETPISPVKSNVYDKDSSNQALINTNVSNDIDTSIVNIVVSDMSNDICTDSVDNLPDDSKEDDCNVSNSIEIDESFLSSSIEIKQDSSVSQDYEGTLEDCSISSIHEGESGDIEYYGFGHESIASDENLNVTQLSGEDRGKFEDFIFHVKETISLSEEVLSLNVPVDNTTSCASCSGDDILSDVNRLFENCELSNATSIMDFSGFDDSVNKHNELQKRLNNLKKEVHDIETLFEIRKENMEQVNRDSHEQIDANVSLVVSPPFTRSQGRALDLPLVQGKVLEYKK